MKKSVFLFLITFSLLSIAGRQRVYAQQYTGMSGLIHVPSADMDPAGEARLGVHFLNREFTPDVLVHEDEKYHTMSHYLSITPFKWLEIGYTCTLLKSARTKSDGEELAVGLYRKDRYFSIKIQPIAEKRGKWWPSIAVGTNDTYKIWERNEPRPLTEQEVASGKRQNIGNNFFSNYYVAVSKHFLFKGHSLGLHVAYRNWQRPKNSKWNGPVGGITYQPAFQKNLRLITEYTGDDVNVGFDWKLWKHLLIQSSLQNGKYFSGGVCFCINLL